MVRVSVQISYPRAYACHQPEDLLELLGSRAGLLLGSLVLLSDLLQLGAHCFPLLVLLRHLWLRPAQLPASAAVHGDHEQRHDG